MRSEDAEARYPSRGGRDLQPPGGTNSRVMDHVGRRPTSEMNELPLCKRGTSLLPPPETQGKDPGAGGEKSSRGWRSWSSQLLEAGMLEDGQARTEVNESSFSELE